MIRLFSLFCILLLSSPSSWSKSPMDGAKLGAPLPANLWIEMSKMAQPAVVGVFLDIDIKRTHMRRDPLFDFLEEFYGRGFEFEDPRQNQDEKSSPIGTGFIIDDQGHIVSNYHVVEAVDDKRINTKLQVQIQGHDKLFDVEVVGRDPRGDLALLKIKSPPKNLKHLEFGDSDQLQVGEYVAAFGNPFGHSNSMTVGIVSAKGRTLKELNRFPFIQTDASINPGNSGGPLLNTQGYVIGVNTAIDARAQGIGFAIPANFVKKIIQSLKSGETIKRGFLGAALGQLSSRAARQFGLKRGGVVIAGLEPGYPAEKSGLEVNDIVYEFNGIQISEVGSFINLVKDTEPGTTVPIKVLRPTQSNFRELTLNVTLGSFPGETRTPKISPKGKAPKPNKYIGQSAPFNLGFAVTNSSSGARRHFDIPIRFPFGPIVSEVEPGSPADKGGIKVGMIILRVNNVGVNDTSEVIKSLKNGVNRIWLQTNRGEIKISIKPE